MTEEPQDPGRRRALFQMAWLGGVAVAYSALAAMCVRFLYPAQSHNTEWLFVTDLSLPVGASIAWKTPGGARIAIARQGQSGNAEDFIALSSTCPHLGCQVSWESANSRFFCPCHNGVFNPAGKAIEGPPAEAKQSLLRYPLKVEQGLLYIEVPKSELAAGEKRA